MYEIKLNSGTNRWKNKLEFWYRNKNLLPYKGDKYNRVTKNVKDTATVAIYLIIYIYLVIFFIFFFNNKY